MFDKDFEIFYRKYYKNLLLYAYSMCKDYYLSEELVQNTFIKVLLYDNLDYTYIKSFMVRVLKNEYIDIIRKNRSTQKYLESIKNKDNTIPSVLEKILSKEEYNLIISEIENLPENYKIVMKLSVLMEMKDKEISTLLGKNEDNIRKIRSRARKKLKELIESREKIRRGKYEKAQKP